MSPTKEEEEKIRKQTRLELEYEAGTVFTPSAPIDEKALFAGRTEQLHHVIGAISQRGQHAIIFGERGVGKTSLANVLSDFLEGAGQQILAPRVNCDTSDKYHSLWRKIFSEIEISKQTKQAGFRPAMTTESASMAEAFQKHFTPEDVRKALTFLTSDGSLLLIVIIDEFDRIGNGGAKKLFADTIKTLSDHSVRATLVLVGVADTVDELIEEHQSIERALVQIRMPRMSRDELAEIIKKGLAKLKMEMDLDAQKRITLLSQGLPHYTHLLSLHACYEAINKDDKRITLSFVEGAIKKALTKAQQTIRNAYHKATMSTRKENLYAPVLLGCALAKTDDLGYFAAADVRNPMGQIMSRPYDIPAFSRHLYDFCEEARGSILQKTGTKHRIRFRFTNPIMQPFVIMQGFADGKIPLPTLEG